MLCGDKSSSKLGEMSFMVKEDIVLGHKVSIHGIKIDRAKIEIIGKLPSPITVKGIKIFFDHVRFYRRFIKDFSKIIKPFCKLLEKDIPFVLDEKCLLAF